MSAVQTPAKRLTDLELAELRALDAVRSLAVENANAAMRYCAQRLIVMLKDHGVDVAVDGSEWVPDLSSGVVIQVKGPPQASKAEVVEAAPQASTAVASVEA